MKEWQEKNLKLLMASVKVQTQQLKNQEIIGNNQAKQVELQTQQLKMLKKQLKMLEKQRPGGKIWKELILIVIGIVLAIAASYLIAPAGYGVKVKSPILHTLVKEKE